MAMYTRANAWNNNGTFDNPDLLWYARAVGAMQSRGLNDTSGWWLYAAIHGEYVNNPGFPGWGSLPAPPAVPTSPLPQQNLQDLYWDQCQHQSWYFLPWHRGYLLALEAQIRADVINLGGPSTWALPYWDYLAGDQSGIPPAFTQQNLPDGTPNPLFVAARYGPNNDGNIFIPIPPVNQDCLSNDLFTGDDANTPPPGFGGPNTGFSHSGGSSGNLENNPHNLVHVFVGGNSPDGQTYGLMSDPGIAALDPIFYIHHANIDRLWAAWNQNVANTNPTDPNWLNGPASIGQRAFAMPNPDGSSWGYTPQQMTSLSQLNYAYDALPQPAPAANALAARLTQLGAAAALTSVRGVTVTTGTNMELVGASEKAVPITGSGASTSVRLDPGVRNKVSRSLALAAETAAPDRVFLNLENVRGTHDASVLNVYLNVPAGDKPSDHPELLVGSVALFGLRKASQTDQGLHFVLDATNIIDTLHLNDALNTDSLDVKIVPHQPVPDQAQITVGRVSLYRKGQ